MTTAPVKVKKPPQLFTVRGDANGIKISLSKSAAFAMAKTRDIFAALAKGAPTVSAQAKGIEQAIGKFMGDIGNTTALDKPDDWESRIDESH